MKVERASVGGSLDRSKERLARAAEVLRLEARTIAHLEERLGPDFLSAVESVLACEGHVVVTGVGKAGLVGQKISATLASTGTPSIFLHPTEAQHGDLGRIRKRDLLFAISNSGETAEINSLIGPARRIGVKIVALTGVARSTLARNSDTVLDIGEIEEACPLKLAPTASTSAMLAMGDALAMVVSQERNFGREEYALYHPGGMLGRKLMRVAEVMRSGAELPLLSQEESLAQAIMKMNRTPGRPGAVLITGSEGRLVGIFTHGDLARLMEGDAALDKRAPIERLMGKNPKSIGSEQLVEEATRRMKEHRVDQIAVIDADGRPIGLLDVQDLLDVRL